MNSDTVELLQECSAGCKMCMDTISGIKDQVEDKQLIEIMNKYYDAHSQLEAKCRQLLNDAGEKDKDPGTVAKFFADLQAKTKLMVSNDVHQAAEILTKGCNMGVTSLSGYINQLKNADQESTGIAEKLRRLEESMIGDLQPML